MLSLRVFKKISQKSARISIPNSVALQLKLQRHASTFRISPEISQALENNLPVVALESAIITHGMPHPHNINTALQVQSIIREQGAIPATIGVIKGQLTVGLTNEEIEFLGSTSPVIKVSRRDLPYALSQKNNGGTTVSGTIIAAVRAGIPIFVTGGLGGVHRGAETSFDISADLNELGRNPIAVVSAGVKSILDIGKTLEYLETQGVCVCVLSDKGHGKFPSFFTPESEFVAPYKIDNETQAAQLIHSSIRFGLKSGILIGVPIPKDGEEFGAKIENAIKMALDDAVKQGIKGRYVTPFVLSKVNEITGGDSMDANKILIYNNAKVGAQIAVELSKIGQTEKSHGYGISDEGFRKQTNVIDNLELDPSTRGIKTDCFKINRKPGARPVVIGGSSLDLIFTLDKSESDVVNDGRTHKAHLKSVPGGVGRNLAEALQLTGQKPFLISNIGEDLFGREIQKRFQDSKMDTTGISISRKTPTSIYSAILTNSGECSLGLGQMDAHDEILPTTIQKHEKLIKSASIVIMDANIPLETMIYIMELCTEAEIPVWFEPTELRKAKKLLQVPTEYWPCLTYISPNSNELHMISDIFTTSAEEVEFDTAIQNCFEKFVGLQFILLTRGKLGFSTIYREVLSSTNCHRTDYPPPTITHPESVVSVSGAGDCLNAGFISGLLEGKYIGECSDLASACAKQSLISSFNVPSSLKAN